jgi:DNA-binding GntR family transcriptional regulator
MGGQGDSVPDRRRAAVAGRRGAVPLRQAAYERIEDLLNGGSLRPGQLITQRFLVDRTGATLASVREAVSRLVAEGLLVTVPQRGLMVPSLDVAFVREAYELRRVLELAAVRGLARRLGSAEMDDWFDWHGQARARLSAAAGPDREAVADEIQRRDWDLHQRIIESMDNALIANVYRVTAIKIRMAVQSRIKVRPDNALRVIDEHLAILAAVRAGDDAAASAALDRHVDNSLRIALGGEV